jgi:gamma-glutamyltranspeptidase/glutathione hydrolase
MASWVNSNFANFGSGVTIPGYGFTLHDRGALFSLDPSSPNAIAPHKQPFNTLAAAFVMSGNEPAMTLQLMGGDMQAQGHAQVLVNLLDFGANVQAAGDMARFHHDQSLNEVELETQLYEAVGAQLQAMGHRVRKANRLWMGGYQAIAVTPHPGSKQSARSFRAGSDFGKDGQAVGY